MAPLHKDPARGPVTPNDHFSKRDDCQARLRTVFSRHALQDSLHHDGDSDLSLAASRHSGSFVRAYEVVVNGWPSAIDCRSMLFRLCRICSLGVVY